MIEWPILVGCLDSVRPPPHLYAFDIALLGDVLCMVFIP